MLAKRKQIKGLNENEGSMKLIKINPPFYFYFFFLIIVILHLLTPVVKFVYYPFTLLGIIPILIGIILNLAADSSFKKNDTTVKPLLEAKVLITTGIFKITRNPMYLGFVLILLGIAILLGTILPFIVIIIFAVFLDIIFIKYEEKKLENIFESKWHEYKNSVRRWI